MSDEPKTCLTDGSEPSPGYRNIKENGQQLDYLVLCPEERAKGFIRQVRRSYRHVGEKKPSNLRDLTPEEKERLVSFGYVKFETYEESGSPVVGKFWTQAELARLGGCGVVTVMDLSLAETYARDPTFYGATFCCGCGKHFPVSEFLWVPDGSVVGS